MLEVLRVEHAFIKGLAGDDDVSQGASRWS
jgi:hypothetical protein